MHGSQKNSKVVHRKKNVVIIVHHEDFKTINGDHEDLYTLPRWFKITEEGPSDEFFSDSSSTNGAIPTNSGNATSKKDFKAPTIVQDIDKMGRVIKSSLANLGCQIQIDHDNSPATENLPSSVRGEDNGTNDAFSSGWGHDEICCHCQAEGHNAEGK